MRVDEIGDIERATNRKRDSVKLHLLRDETRFPFVINLPQHDMEPALRDCLAELEIRNDPSPASPDRLHAACRPGDARTRHAGWQNNIRCKLSSGLRRRTQHGARAARRHGRRPARCRSAIRWSTSRSISTSRTRATFPTSAYFSDAKEWMILVRQPECWRFLYPVSRRPARVTDRRAARQGRGISSATSTNVEVVGTNLFKIYHRVAGKWRHGRVVLLGDAAHLITPMWALGLNTGILDANSLAWRMAWVHARLGRRDACSTASSASRSRSPNSGSGEMAEAARAYMRKPHRTT